MLLVCPDRPHVKHGKMNAIFSVEMLNGNDQLLWSLCFPDDLHADILFTEGIHFRDLLDDKIKPHQRNLMNLLRLASEVITKWELSESPLTYLIRLIITKKFKLVIGQLKYFNCSTIHHISMWNFFCQYHCLYNLHLTYEPPALGQAPL